MKLWAFQDLEVKNIKFVSFEPLLGEFPTNLNLKMIDWVIIGGLTPRPVHQEEWVDQIVGKARKEKIPVFLKDNLGRGGSVRELPSSRKRKESKRKERIE